MTGLAGTASISVLMVGLIAGCGQAISGAHPTSGTAFQGASCEHVEHLDYLTQAAHLKGGTWTALDSGQFSLSDTGYILYVVKFKSGEVGAWAAKQPVGSDSTFVPLNRVASRASGVGQASKSAIDDATGKVPISAFTGCVS